MWRPWEDGKKSEENENSLKEIHEQKSNKIHTHSSAETNLVEEGIPKNVTSKRSYRFLDLEQKRQVLDVYFKIKNQFGEKGAIEKTTIETNVPQTTVWRLVRNGAKGRKPRKDKGSFKNLTDKHAWLIRDTIRRYCKENTRRSVRVLHEMLVEDQIISAEECSVETLRKFLNSRDMFV